MVPGNLADKMKRRMEIEPEYFKAVTILFTDVFGFNRISSECGPDDIVVLMNSLYGTIDGLLKGCNIYKVETNKECYMVVSGKCLYVILTFLNYLIVVYLFFLVQAFVVTFCISLV